MQQTNVKTPCRRIGLRRIPSAAKSDSFSSLPVSAGTHESNPGTPKSRASLSSMSDRPANTQPNRRVIDLQDYPVEDHATLFVVKPSEERDLYTIGCGSDNSLKRPYRSSDTHQSDIKRANKAKMSKLASSVVPPSQEDLRSLQRRVIQKESRLKELSQAQIICNKHNPEKLKRDIQHWLYACQEALQDLLTAVVNQGNNIDMERLLQELGIPPLLVCFNVESQEFE